MLGGKKESGSSTGFRAKPTPADFYTGGGNELTYVGSVAFDGFPKALPWKLVASKTQEEYLRQVELLFKNRRDGAAWRRGEGLPTEGPYAYTFSVEGNCVLACFKTRGWQPADGEVDPLFGEVGAVVLPDPMTCF